jgi:hypothetical protein
MATMCLEIEYERRGIGITSPVVKLPSYVPSQVCVILLRGIWIFVSAPTYRETHYCNFKFMHNFTYLFMVTALKISGHATTLLVAMSRKQKQLQLQALLTTFQAIIKVPQIAPVYKHPHNWPRHYFLCQRLVKLCMVQLKVHSDVR